MAIREEKEITNLDWKRNESFIAGDMILHIENPKGTIRTNF